MKAWKAIVSVALGVQDWSRNDDTEIRSNVLGIRRL
jgi:hypothetical protein